MKIKIQTENLNEAISIFQIIVRLLTWETKASSRFPVLRFRIGSTIAPSDRCSIVSSFCGSSKRLFYYGLSGFLWAYQNFNISRKYCDFTFI